MVDSRRLKICIFIVGAMCIGLLLKQFCYHKAAGFSLARIRSDLTFNPEWEPRYNCNEFPELPKVLNQPFYYLDKGAQAYVFASADGETVIKFFRMYRKTIPSWMKSVCFPQVLQPFKIKKIIDKQKGLHKDFRSYRIALEEMKEETGLLYLHLNKTSHLKQSLRIYDKRGVAHDLNADEMEFLIQKRAKLVYPALDALVNEEGMDAAKEAIAALVCLLRVRCQKGIFDKDPNISTNFGFLGRRPIQIDIGRFSQDIRVKSAFYREEILRITDKLGKWLDRNHPDLSEHLLSEIQKIPEPI